MYQEDHPYFDVCQECKHSSFIQDTIEYQRVCTNCGLTTAFEFGVFPTYETQPTYSRYDYFVKRSLHSIMKKKMPVHTTQELDEVCRLFRQCVENFEVAKAHHGRKNFPNHSFVFYKILKGMGKTEEELRVIQLPRLQKTLDRLEHDWTEYINPYTD